MSLLRALWLLNRRKTLELKNTLLHLTDWEWAKVTLFSATGLAILFGLHVGFMKVLRYLEGVQLIGGLLTWKLTAMALLTTFWMVAISNLIAAISTLFYARDMQFLWVAPLPPRSVFLMKSIEAAVYASWMVALALFPYILALARVKGLGFAFVGTSLALIVPFLALSASIGIFFTLLLMYFFPTSRTRDAVWILSSASMALVYVVIRFAQPEQLVRPDALERVAQYLQYLQAPTAQYFPSWWMTQAMLGLSVGNYALFWRHAAAISLGALAAYGLMALLADRMYWIGVSGAQEGRRSGGGWSLRAYPEERISRALPRIGGFLSIYWKDRKLFFRDVKHWSQLMLIFSLVIVYLFSVSRLPLDTPQLKSLASFLNIGAAGFVMAALGLRFTFPSVSMEGGAFWAVQAAPVTIRQFLWEKFAFSVVPMMAMGGALVGITNWLLGADWFVAWFSFLSMMLVCWTLCGMGVGFGAIFPKFDVENIHQIESSAGGFAYMACGMGYIGATLALEAWVVQRHFVMPSIGFGAWDFRALAWTLASLAALNTAAFAVPWQLGIQNLEGWEGE